MVRLVTRGRLTKDYAKGLVAAPEDREPAVKKLIESVGVKLINFYFTTGDSDFLIVTEGDDAESVIAALLATAGAGTISDISTARAWTGKEFKAVAERLPKQRRRTRHLASTKKVAEAGPSAPTSVGAIVCGARTNDLSIRSQT
jgi:uncharacterized protein with GYD domain